MSDPQPPTATGPLAKRDMRLAYVMLLPTFAIVLGIVLGPLLANFWIAFKPVGLADLRAAQPLANVQLRPRPKKAGQEVILRYRIRNSSQKDPLNDVVMRHVLPSGLQITLKDDRCALADPSGPVGPTLTCDFGKIDAKGRFNLQFPTIVSQAYLDAGLRPRANPPSFEATARNVLTSFEFTLDNFRRIFASPEFWDVMWVSMVYTIGGTGGALQVPHRHVREDGVCWRCGPAPHRDDDLTIRSPGKGLPPYRSRDLVGRKAKQAMQNAQKSLEEQNLLNQAPTHITTIAFCPKVNSPPDCVLFVLPQNDD